VWSRVAAKLPTVKNPLLYAWRSSDPACSSNLSFGALANGQSFQASISLQSGTNLITSSEWASTDGKASFAWPDSSPYSYSQRASFSANSKNQDVLTLVSETPTKNGSRPPSVLSTYNLTFAAGTLQSGAITSDELAAAITEGKLLGATGSASFDSCTMIQNYWGSACSGRMTYAISGLSINGASAAISGAIPEPQTWATLLLGLCFIGARRLAAISRREPWAAMS
jgi:hypothetical protein